MIHWSYQMVGQMKARPLSKYLIERVARAWRKARQLVTRFGVPGRRAQQHRPYLTRLVYIAETWITTNMSCILGWA